MTDLNLNDGRSIPALGMGTWQVPDSQAASIVRSGLDMGYRLVDTAAIYQNERGVGDGCKSSQVFLTTKLWNDRHDDVAAAMDESLALLGVESVDLYLIHWPVPAKNQFIEAWKGLIALRDAGKAKSIGVSNFLPDHIDAIVAATGITPAVNQIELHPRFQQREQRAYHAAHGIVTQSWSPLGQGKDLLSDPVITGIAKKHHRSAAQVILAWHLANGFSVIPKASDAAHLKDNLDSAGFELDGDDLAAVDALDDPQGRLGPHPDTM